MTDREIQTAGDSPFCNQIIELLGMKDAKLIGIGLFLDYHALLIMALHKDFTTISKKYLVDDAFKRKLMTSLGLQDTERSVTIRIEIPTMGIVKATIEKIVDQRILDLPWNDLQEMNEKAI